MKTIKNTFFSLLVLFIGTSLITSCSKDNETNNSVSENTKVSKYLKSFYSKNYQLGQSIDTKFAKNPSALSKSVEVENLIITEVFVGEDTRARGYIITSKDTNDFLYFIDVDRVDYKLTTIKIEANDTKVFNNIDELDKYLTTDKFDVIKMAEIFNSDTNSTIVDKRRFWGTGYSYGAAFTGIDGGCYQGVYSNYYVLGINVSGDPSPVMVQGSSGGLVHAYVPCGETYQP